MVAFVFIFNVDAPTKSKRKDSLPVTGATVCTRIRIAAFVAVISVLSKGKPTETIPFTDVDGKFTDNASNAE